MYKKNNFPYMSDNSNALTFEQLIGRNVLPQVSKNADILQLCIVCGKCFEL